MAVLELREVSYTYPDSSSPALDRITCRLETGRFVALLGRNGSGKSTLALIAAGLLDPASGSVASNGVNLLPGWSGVGLLFQNPDEQLLAQDVEGELAWGLENLTLPPDEIESRVRKGLQQFGLTDKAHLPPEALSDGQKQLVALTALVVMKPAFLLLDEVTAFLDPYWTKRVLRITRELARDAGVLWISTRAAEAVAADEVWLMSQGKIVSTGTPQDMLIPHRLEQLGIEPP